MATEHSPERSTPDTGAIEPAYLTEQQAATLLGLSSHALRLGRYRGRLLGATPPPWVKLGRCVRYRRAELLAWAESVAVEHRAESGGHDC